MTVYVIQRQMKWDNDTEEWVPQFNMNQAHEYGEVVYLLGPKATPYDKKVVRELKLKLKDFSSSDFLLLTGNPCLIGLATAIASRKSGGFLKFLQWSGKYNKYLEIGVVI